jgi:hypothetical protein
MFTSAKAVAIICAGADNSQVDFIYRKQVDNKNTHLFTDFDGTRNNINIARSGDHGSWLLEEASERVGKVYTLDLGRNPATSDT